jgi:hypothetical protein
MAAPKGQPEVRISVHRLFGEPRDFTLSYPLSAEHDEMLAKIHREHGGRQIVQDLTCAAHGVIWLVVADIPDQRRGHGARRWSLRHWPGSGLGGGHYVTRRGRRMSDEHKQWRDYAWRCADDHPKASAVKERSVARGTQSDVAMFGVDGQPVATAELQLSDETETNVFRRDTAVVNRGISPFWFGRTDARPNWAKRVAWLGANRLEHMRPGGWTLASGHRGVTWERCTPSSPMPCPFSRSWCGRVHPMWEPRGGIVDDFIDRLLDGDLVRANIGTSVIAATPADVEAWADHFNADPTVAAARAAEAARRTEIRNGKPVLHTARQAEPAAMRRELPACARCGKPTWRATSGPCAGCRLAASPLPVPEVVPPLSTASQCRKCGTRLIACYPGQQYHPTCDPAPVTLSGQIAEGRI